MGAIANVVGMSQMNPSVKDLGERPRTHDFPTPIDTPLSPVPRITPIMRNRNEKVQEACINLIGRIGAPGSLLS